MHLLETLRTTLAALALSAAALAQSGVLDQQSPVPGAGQWASFNVSGAGYVWQQQVRAGAAGELERLSLRVNGPVGSRVLVRLRPGSGWSSAAPLFQATLVKSAGGSRWVELDTRAAHIQVVPGTTFVIELAGDGSGGSVDGSYTPAPAGAPQYDEPLFLNSPSCYAGCGWRIGFRTYVRGDDVTEFCFGAHCPCGNDSGDAGCVNSTGSGAVLFRSGGGTSVASDDLALAATQLPHDVNATFFMGSAQARTPFGDGLRCAGGATRRFGLFKTSATGGAQLVAPVAASNGAIAPGSSWIFQVWYRDWQGPCSQGANLSNALQVSFAP